MIGQYPGDRCGATTFFPSMIVAGSPTRSATSGSLNTWSRTDLGGTRLTYTLNAGDSVVWGACEDWRFDMPPDGGIARGYWIVQTDGGGTLEVGDAYDLGYFFPTSGPFTDRAYVGTANGLLYFEMDDTFLDRSHLFDDGQPLLKVTCTAGTTLITFLGAQLEQTAGFFAPDGGWDWSGTQPASSQLTSYNGFDPTWATTGSTPVDTTWTVDGTPVLTWSDHLTDSDNQNGRMGGDGDSEDSADAAVIARDVAYGPLEGGSSVSSSGHLDYSNGVGVIGAPESWSASIDEQVSLISGPTKSATPVAPWTDLPPDYLATGEFEFLDTDTSFQGWRIGPANGDTSGIGYEGDAGTATLYASFFDHDPDHGEGLRGGTVVSSLDKETNDNLYTGDLDPVGGGAVHAGFPYVDVTTTDNCLVMSVDCTLRESRTLVHTGMPNGEFTPQSYTGWSVSAFNVPILFRFRIPTCRFKQPTFVLVPGPVVSWVRGAQRGDGLGGRNPRRGRSRPTYQGSIRGRGSR